MSTPIQYCKMCGTALKWFLPGTSKRTGADYEGFWGCPNKKNHPTSSQQAAAFPQPPAESWQPAPAASQPAPQASQYALPNSGSRDRSIEAQAACKAACEAFAGAAPALGLDMDGQHEWIIRLAQRLCVEVITPASQGIRFGGSPSGADRDIPF